VIRVDPARNTARLVTYDTVTRCVFYACAVCAFFRVSTVSSDVVIFLALIAPNGHPYVLAHIDDFTLDSNSLFKEKVSMFRGGAVYFEVGCLLIR
jgi:hypothetical protein